MNDDPTGKSFDFRVVAEARSRPARHSARPDPVSASLHRAYAATLAEPIPDNLLALLQRLE